MSGARLPPLPRKRGGREALARIGRIGGIRHDRLGGSPRKVNLNLPSDYLSKPWTKFAEWLEANTTSLRMLTEEQIIQKARAALGPDLARLNNGDLAAQIREWAKSHGFVLPGGGGSAPVRAGT